MRKWLIIFAVTVCSSCAQLPDRPDPADYIGSLEKAKASPVPEITLEKIDLPSIEGCGDKICVSGEDMKRLQFILEQHRQKLTLRHEANKIRTASQHELVDTLEKALLMNALSEYQNALLAKDNERLQVKATLTRALDILAIAASLGLSLVFR